jgi:hypothetical protein
MLFRQDALDRIRDGRVSVVFRRWRQARVRAGTRLRTMIGLVEIRSVEQVADAREPDAGPAGYPSVEALRADIPGDPAHHFSGWRSATDSLRAAPASATVGPDHPSAATSSPAATRTHRPDPAHESERPREP